MLWIMLFAVNEGKGWSTLVDELHKYYLW